MNRAVCCLKNNTTPGNRQRIDAINTTVLSNSTAIDTHVVAARMHQPAPALHHEP